MTMKRLISTTLITFLMVMGLSPPVLAEMATMDDASTVANNWITLIIEKKGDWGGSETAEVVEIQEFKRDERVIGYFCHVGPQGFIVISLHKELAPVKAYSATCDMDPLLDEGLVDVIKGGMERIIKAVETQIGPIESVRTEDLENILEIDYRDVWVELEEHPESFDTKLESSESTMNYHGGDVLLTSSWHQRPPYNQDCPAPPRGDDCTEPRCIVGCVATAGAQIMRYWNWPPYGVDRPFSDTYDWHNMPDRIDGSSTQAEIDAVAELCHEVGIAVDMNYCGSDGCASGAATADMEGVYENCYRYATNCEREDRDDYDDPADWFNIMKSDLNANRPIQYKIYGHSIVGDGWQEIGSPVVRQYHMNYGWGWTGTFPDGNNTWYTLDALHCDWEGCSLDEEYMLVNIYPAQAMGSSVSGIYPLEGFPYRYFDRDAIGFFAIFEAGQYLQFLPGGTVTCVGSIDFEGSSPRNTRLFTRGDISRGIRIYNGAIKLNPGGSIKFE